MTKEKFEEIYRRHYPDMYRLARTILYDADDCKDVVSEIFARLLRGNIVPQAEKLEGYLMTSVRNQCRDVLRHKNVRECVEKLFSAEIRQNQGKLITNVLQGILHNCFSKSKTTFIYDIISLGNRCDYNI